MKAVAVWHGAWARTGTRGYGMHETASASVHVHLLIAKTIE